MLSTFLRRGYSIRSICCPVALLVATMCMIGTATPSFAQDADQTDAPIAGDLFQLPPATPDKIIEAAILTQKLDRQDDARKFLRKLLDQQLDESELRALRQRLGAAPFLELSADRKLQPEARDLLLAVNAASKPQPLSTAELQQLIQALATPGEDATNAAVAIVANGDSSAAALLATDVSTPAGKVADQLLKTQARQMRRGLMTELNVADPAGRSRIVRLLAGTADPEIALGLLRWQFDSQSDAASRETVAMAVERLSGGRLEAATAEEASELLTDRSEALMKSAANRFARFREPAVVNEIRPSDRRAELLGDATLYLTDAVALDATNSRAVSLMLVAKSAVTDPAMTVAASVAAGQTVTDLANSLVVALEIGEAHGGIEILRALKACDFSAIDDESQQLCASAFKSAVNSPDPRIRFLAADVAVNVAHSDISSPAVKRTLKSVREGSLKPEAVVVDSNDKTLRDLDVALEDAGYTVGLSQTGQDGFAAAASQMNCELILVNAESAGWPLATTLANLRSDVRTQGIPIVVIGPDRFAKRVSRLGEIHSGIWFLAEPVGIESLALKLEALLLPRHLLSPEDRAAMKQIAGQE